MRRPSAPQKSLFNKPTKRAATLLLILLGASLTASAADRVEIDGYFKSYFVGYRLPSVSAGQIQVSLPPLGSVSNRLRLNTYVTLGDDVTFAAAYDFAPRVQDRQLFETPLTPGGTTLSGYRVDDLPSRMYPSQGDEVASFGIFQNLDRTFFEIRTDRVDFFVGRQPIAWGSARSVNPTDILAPFAYEALDTEDRIGVDAVRARVPLGFMGELDAGYVFGEDFEFDRSAFYLRGKMYVAQTDLALLAVGFRENLLLGVDMARSVGGAGVWLEASHVLVDTFDDDNRRDGEDYFRSTVGFDYSLSGDDYLFLEYHYNGAGGDDPNDYADDINRVAFAEGGTYLLGRHYLIPGASLQITPLLTGAVEMLWNVSDGSAYLAPSAEYSLGDDAWLSGGAFVGLGTNPSVSDGARSEFGSYPDMFYSSFRVYF